MVIDIFSSAHTVKVMSRVDKFRRRVQQTETPNWWFAAQVIAGAVFGAVLLFYILVPSGGSSEETAAVPDQTPVYRPPVNTAEPTVQPTSPTPGTPTVQPTAPATPTLAPTTDPTNMVQVTTQSGETLSVPKEVMELSKTLNNIFEPDAFKNVRTSGYAPTPLQGTSSSTVGPVILLGQDDQGWVFVADVDIDGPGPTAGYPHAIRIGQDSEGFYITRVSLELSQ